MIDCWYANGVSTETERIGRGGKGHAARQTSRSAPAGERDPSLALGS